jgi:hypothetical protein
MSLTFFTRKGSVGEFEGLHVVGLEPEGAPDPRDRGTGQAARRGHRTGRPLCCIPRGRVQGFGNHPLHLGMGDRRRSTWSRLVAESGQSPGQEAPAPLAHGLLRHPQMLGHCLIALASRRSQHDATAQGQGLGGGAPTSPLFQQSALAAGQSQRRDRTAASNCNLHLVIGPLTSEMGP